MVDRERATREFERYTGAYDANDPKIALKIYHTWQVAGLCEQIARAEGFSPEDVDLAWLCGLLHDIGRFEQVRRYDTFYDAKSVSHAALGVEVLFGEQARQVGAPTTTNIRNFVEDPASDSVIRRAVGLHSAYQLPSTLDARTRAFCDVVRDADKVDILRVNCESPADDVYGIAEADVQSSPVSPEVIDVFYAHETVLASIRRYPADIVVSHACFVWGLIYPESVRISRDHGHALAMLARPFTNGQTAETFAAMRAHLAAWYESVAD